jgi:hypothetical protein
MDQIILYLTAFSRLVFGSDQLVQNSINQIHEIFHSDAVLYRAGKMTERFHPGRMDHVSFTPRDSFPLLHLLSSTAPSLSRTSSPVQHLHSLFTLSPAHAPPLLSLLLTHLLSPTSVGYCRRRAGAAIGT